MVSVVMAGFVSGIVATLVMDFCALTLIKKKLIKLSGLQIVPPLLGRWLLVGFKSGKFLHQDIRKHQSEANEMKYGLFFHYLIGAALGGFFVVIFTNQFISNGLTYGIMTNVFPWLIMYPSMGFGFFANKLDLQKELLKLSFINHALYGISLGIFVWMFISLLQN